MLPVEHQRFWYDDQSWISLFNAKTSIFQKRQHLDCFTQTHVVREASTKVEFLEEFQPANPFTLIRSKFALERRWFAFRLDPVECRQSFTCFQKLGVEIDVFLGSQQCVDDADLNRVKPQVFTVSNSKSCQQAIFDQPFFRQNA